jgi:N-acetylmuramoyl-L-alanine amidase
LTITSDTVLLPASALTSGKTLTIIYGDVSFTLPLDKLNLADLAKELGVDLKDLMIKVEMKKLTGDAAKAVKDAADAIGATLLSDAYDFIVTAVGSNGKTKVITDFGNTYVSRTISFNGTVDTYTSTGVLYDPTAKKLSFVPTTFVSKDTKTTATLKRNGNSVYVVVKLKKTFADISTHWAKADIELLANKLVVEGVNATTFEPERSINRAEFAALVVRSLGLTVNTGSASDFSDVKSDAWYAGVVTAAKKAGLINGYEDGTFRPNATITREELAAMVLRALKFAGQDLTVSASEQASILNKFKDAKAIVWGQAEVASAIKAGIINGMDNVTLNTKGNSTRAQSATVLKRALTKAGFIN